MALSKLRDEVELGASLGYIVEDLVRRAGLSARAEQLVHVSMVEVADAPSADLAAAHKRLHALDGLGQRHGPAPVEEVEIEVVGLQALQASLAGALDPAAARVLGVDLADQEDLVTHAGQGLAEQAFAAAIALHLGCVDQRHAQLDAGAQRRNLLFAQARILAHSPRASAEF